MVSPVVSAVKHSILRTFSVFCVIAVLALIGLGIKRIIYPPKTESYQQKAEQIQNYETNFYPSKKVFGLGLTLWGWDIGIVKLDYPKEKTKNDPNRTTAP